MRLRSYQRIGASLILIIFLLACALPSLQPADEANPFSSDPLSTAIIETAVVAQTQTAHALPPTLTPTLTREATSTIIAAPPTQTPFSLFSPTPEFGIPLETIDPLYAVTAGISGLGPVDPQDAIPYTGQPWTCLVKSVTPAGGFIQPETEFYAYWTVINTGTKTWSSTTVDFVHKSGYRHVGIKIQDLNSAVAPGRSATFKAFFVAPKKAGEYGATYVLKVGSKAFCGMYMYFEVPKKSK